MGKVESIIKSEVMRLAKREVRAAYRPLRREVWAMRLKLSGLAKNMRTLDKVAKEQMRRDESKKFQLQANPEEVKASRFTPERIRRLRQRLGLSQKKLALLTGVSIGAVGLWEKGKFAPSAIKKAALVALRKFKKRDMKKMLAEKVGKVEKKQPRARRGKKAGAKRRFSKPGLVKAKPRRRRKA